MKLLKLKKMLALMLAATMVLGTTTTALAAGGTGSSGGTTGEGGVEFVYNENVFQVALPTVPEDDTTLDFQLDPMKVMYATKAESGITMASEASLVFTNVNFGADGVSGGDDDTTSYSNTSDAYTIINKSSFDVTVTAKAEITGADVDAKKASVTGEGGVYAKFVDTLTVAGDDSTVTDAEIVLALQGTYMGGEDGQTSQTAKDAIDNETYTAQIIFDMTHNADAYEVKYDSDNDGAPYAYDLKDDATFTNQTATIQLTGECNDHVNWTKLGDIAPDVAVTWSVAPKGLTDDQYDDRISQTFTVTFDVGDNGGEAPDALTVKENRLATKPADPTSEGLIFAGWYTDDTTFQNEYDFTEAVTKNITLYAKWVGIGVESFEMTVGATANKVLTVVFPTGVTKITSIKNNTAGSNLALTTHYTVSGTSLTLKGTYLKTLAEGAIEYTITFADGSTADFTITVNAAG